MSDNIEDLYPLTPLQAGMLFHCLNEQGEGLYVNQLTCELRGRLDERAFEAAWREAVRANPVLRTAFEWEGVDEPLQVLLREVELPFRSEDWRDTPGDEIEARLGRLASADRRRGFNLDEAPLLRLWLLRTGDEAHRFVFTHHHILLDGWSLPNLLRQVFALYATGREGRPGAIEPPRPFRDYIEWLDARGLSEAEAFFRRAFDGFEGPTPLGPAGGVPGAGRGQAFAALPPEATRALGEAARRSRLTPSTFVQGAWALLLGARAGQRDVVYGTTVSGRPAELRGVEEMVGLFINTLPVRARWTPDERLVDWLAAQQAHAVELRQHEHAPLNAVRRWAGAPPGEPLFDSAVIFENYPVDAALRASLPGLDVATVRALETDNFALSLTAVPGPSLRLTLGHDLTRFDRGAAERLLARFVRLLERMAERPESRLGDLVAPDGAERRQLITDWNATRAEFPRDALLPDLVAAQARRTPDATALVGGGESLTYAQLEARADRLARRLRALGVGPEVRVGVCLERSCEAVVALLAVLKAGGAYLPLDPSHPPERLAFLLEDSGARVLIARPGRRAPLPPPGGTPPPLLVDPAGGPDEAPDVLAAPGPEAGPDNLAYVIYTSGSTGRPKGVAVHHRALTNYVIYATRHYELAGEGDGVVQSSFGFDLTVTSLWAPLVTGRRVLLASPEDELESFVALARGARASSLLKLTPSHLALLTPSLEADGASLREARVVVGGEALTAAAVAALRERAPSARVFNEYGPTEATVGCCVYEVPAELPSDPGAEIPIGRPVANARVYVLDERLEPVPVEAPGELYVGGEGLARGYLGRPALTAERFVPDPLSGEPGARLYKTGDRARWRDDGQLEYLGRLDFQVKLRGYRVELGEIEAALRRHPGVADAVASVREDTPGVRRLVAHIVPAPGATVEGPALRDALSTTLPEYMVPAAFVLLDRLPTTPNGKLDRKALPAPTGEALGARAYEAPQTELERDLCAVVQDVLRVERVGVHDNFFALGGDSISSLQVVARAKERSIALRPRQLFQHPTVAELARHLAAQSPAVTIEDAPSGPYPPSPVQRWFFRRITSHRHHFNQALLLELAAPVAPARLRDALAALLDHHDALRSRFRCHDGVWTAEVAAEPELPSFATVDLSGASDDVLAEQVRAHCAEAQGALDLERGPLHRALYFDRGDRPPLLFLALHHLAVDGVSWRVLLEDLGTLLRDGGTALPPKTASYRAWARCMAALEEGGGVDAHRPFWSSLPWGELGPAHFERGPNGEAAIFSRSLGPRETDLVLRLAPTLYRTGVHELLIACALYALARSTGRRTVSVNVEGHGRDDEATGLDVSSTVGWFTAMHPVIVGSDDWPDLDVVVRRVEAFFRAMPARGLTFGSLDRGGAPFVDPPGDVSWNYLGRFDGIASGAAPFRRSNLDAGPALHPAQQRAEGLAVNAFVTAGTLSVSFAHARGDLAKAEAFADALLEALGRLADDAARGHRPLTAPLGRAAREALLAGRADAIEDVYPLTPLQQGIFFHRGLEGGGTDYILRLMVPVAGAVDAGTLSRAWQAVVARHASLRSDVLTATDGSAVQLVYRRSEGGPALLDLRGVEGAARAAALDASRDEQCRATAALGREGPVRLTAARVGNEAWEFFLTAHHGLLDGWSLAIFFGELFAAYEAEASGRAAALPRAGDFRDYVLWHGARDAAADEAFWREQLRGFGEVTPLPAAQPAARAAGKTGLMVSPDGALAEALGRAASAQRVTPNTFFVAAWALLLARYAGTDDVVFGVTSSGRSSDVPGIERLIGLLITTVPLRVLTPAGAAAGDWLRGLHELQASLREHERTPLSVIRRASDLSPKVPLFETLFVFENYPNDALTVASRHVRVGLPEAQETTHYPLTITVAPGSPYQVRLTYDERRFERAAVEQLGQHYLALLGALVASPEAPVGSLSPLSAEERHRLLTEWNDAPAGRPPAALVHRLIEAQSRRTPDATALLCGDERRTYAELDAHADRLSHSLRALGVGPEVRVGVCLERSCDLVVALLAVLKAGGAYVPLDPTHPRDRLAFVLEDACAHVLLTHSRLATLPAGPTATRLLIDDPPALTPHRAPPRGEPSAESLAYVIYTSGSTGRPKGVGVPHRAAANFFLAMDSLLDAPANGTWLAATGVGFDISVLELLWTLSRGFAVVVQPETLGTSWFVEALERYGVTHFQCTPSMARTLVEDEASAAALGRLRQFLVGGEALPADLARNLARRAPLVLNMYGPTETTVWSSSCRTDGSVAPVPLGMPVANARLYVLDGALEPSPFDVPGELYIGGEGVARGYLGRPALTAEQFVPDPFSDNPGARLYRTGDRTRRRTDGRLEYLGRLDSQTKIRGHRVELGEIEAALAGHPSVHQAVVSVHEGAKGGARLVAYVVTEPGREFDASELRAALEERLPSYMVPSAFLPLGALPLTPNGKVDRKALPAPDFASLPRAPFLAPRTAAEARLAEVWAEVLGVERVGVGDDFFELGGHSLLATRIVGQVRAAFGVEVPLRAFFEAPTVAALAEWLQGHAPPSPSPPLEPARREGPLPLSFAQQRLWLLWQLEPQSGAYNMPAALRLAGELDVEALRRAFEALVARHETLRTTLEAPEGVPRQTVGPAGPFDLPIADLSARPADEREPEARRLAAEEASRPFDLERAPPLRARLVRLDGREHWLLLTMHHIASDGWSLGVLVRELTQLYRAFVRGEAPTLPALPVQYADYAVWQRGWLRGEALERQVGYWRAQLEGAPPLELPTDRPRPLVPSYQGAEVPVYLPRDLADAAHALARREGVTPFMVLVAAWQLLLARHSGQRDLSVGTPIAGRNRPELEPLIGFFVNTLVLRARLSLGMTFRQLVAQAYATSLGAFEHQDVPFERLVEALEPARDSGRSPLFQALFALQNAPQGDLHAPGLTFEALPLEGATAKFDLSLQLLETASGFTGSLEYRTDLFDRATIERLAGHLRVLLEGALARPDAPVDELSLLTDDERCRVLVDWNATRTAYPREARVHELFEAQARRRPDAIALERGGRTLCYGELEARANRLAHALRGRGVRAGEAVGVCLQRSFDLVAALLAALKVGGAYVPLDPDYPQERLGQMLADAGVRLVVASAATASALPREVEPFVLEAEAGHLSGQPTHAPAAPGAATSLAYVLYTSGSTGRPKGVAVPHRAVVRLVQGTTYVPFGPEQVFLQASPASFDAATFELWGALLHGARLVLAPAHALSMAEWAGLLERHGVTATFMTAALFEQLVDEHGDVLARVPHLVAGGDTLPAERVRALLERGGRVTNGYGPTENTTFTTCATLAAADASSGRVPIGRPIANTTAYVLDDAMGPVPVGVVGELYAGGDGLAWGYLGRPALTAERFVPDPFSSEPGARLYRTGDRARWLPDGQLDFMGRLDSQVKLRGFRIEPGEVEAALLREPGVRQAAVAVREDRPGDERLVAYVVPAASSLDAAALRTALERSLPPYLVPSAIVSLERLPLTAHGKLDRKALPAPDGASLARASYVEPRTATERALAAAFGELLGASRVGADAHFFELGGHSLLATQLISRVRSALGVELPLRALFETPTLGALAARIDEAKGAGAEAPPPRPADRSGPLPLSFAQQRLWFLDRLEPGRATYNLPFALRLEGALDVDALERSFREMVRRHEILRTTFDDVGGEAIQRVHPPPERFDLPLEDLTGLAAEGRAPEARRRLAREAEQPFDLAHGPLLRARLMRLGGREHWLLVTLHHIVTDGWSTSVLVRELGALYASFCQGKRPDLPELPVQYADYAAWQRGLLRGERLERRLAYWRSELAGVAPLDLPADRPRPAQRTGRGGAVPVRASAASAAPLLALCRDEGATPFMGLFAAFALLLYRHRGGSDVCVGTPIAGRTHAELEPLVGFFVNTLPLRARVDGRASFRQLLDRARRTTLGAFEHQDLPFEAIVDALRPDRDRARTPLFQAALALQNAPIATLHAPSLAIEPLALESNTAKFELTLSLHESEGGLEGALEYDADLFDRTTAERLAERFTRLVHEAAAAPDLPLDALPLLDDDERRLVASWGSPPAIEPPVEPTLHARFEAQAERTPDALAISCEGASLTYRELDRRSNRLARRLRGLGVGPEVCVGLCAERSLELVVGILGILKAGGSYVPLDPAYPKERLAFLINDASVSVVVAQRRARDALPEHRAIEVPLDEEGHPGPDDAPGASAAGPHNGPDASAAGPGNLAYVIYTSGSTGRPKGVTITHGNVLRLFCAADGLYDFGPSDVFTLFHSYAFDFSVWELWGALLHGGRLEIVSYAASRSPDAFYALLERERVTVLSQTPSAFRQLVRYEEGLAAPGLGSLRYVVFGGEALDFAALAPWFARRGENGPRLVNMYGITETTVHVTHRELAPDDARGARGSLVGRPVAGWQLHVLDGELAPTPVGVPGEIYVGGAGVARGYLGRPALTAERFVPDPFSGEPGARLYRSGDRARWRDGGELEYLGRLDFQVKVRGHRIELGEIEAALLRHPDVSEAAAIVREDRPDDQRLVAYLVARAGRTLAPTELRAFAARSLPAPLLPSAFVPLDALPLTPNGKLDRGALSAPETRVDLAAFTPPTGPTERALAELWQPLLGVERVGADAHFFELGGHSLLATQIVSRVRSAFGVELPLRALFEAPTLAALAKRIDEAPPCADEPALRKRGTPSSPAPLSPAQERLWFLQRLEPASSAYNVPFALRLEGTLDRNALAATLAALAERHEILRSEFALEAGDPVQRVAPSFALQPRFVDLTALEPAARSASARALAEAEARRPFSFDQGPPARSLLVALSEREHLLIVTLHHALTDGWSTAIVAREFALIYAAFARGEAPRLPALPLQYADYAAWQRERLAGPFLRTELAYWAHTLAGVPPLELPFDRPRSLQRTRRSDREPIALDAATTASLGALCRRTGATPFMALAAALKALFHRYSGQTDLALGTPVAGRNRPELEPLVGCFINTLVLRTDLGGDPTFADLLGRMRDVTVAALARQEAPFEKIVGALDLPRDPTRPPLVQAMLALAPPVEPTAALPGLTMHAVEAAPGAPKLDLMLALHETPDGLEGAFEYDADLFDAATVAQLSRHFVRLLASAVDAPDRPISELPILDETELHHALAAQNDAGATSPLASPNDAIITSPSDALLHELVEAQARLTPDAEAVTDGSSSLTYAQLEARSNHLANALRAEGVGPEHRVGVCLERSIDLVVALLAVLKAGGAYVPIDPDYPEGRLAFMLRDARASALVTRRSLLGSLPGDRPALVFVEHEAAPVENGAPALPATAAPSTTAPAPSATAAPSAAIAPLATPPAADRAAYVIYTSGTTGQPKGAINAHRAVVNRLRWMQAAYPLRAGDRVLHKTPFSFDVSVWELFWPLAVGATMVVARPGGHRDAAYLVRTIDERSVNVVHFVPSMLRAFFAALGGRRLPASLRHVVCSGEALPADLVARFFEVAAPSQALHNLYGPTEAAVDVSAWACRPEDGYPGTSVPIGRPIANARLYVLDRHLRPLPPGAAGELYIGGVPVGRGYLGRPGLTAERFVPDPYGPPGSRLYRTGDRARQRREGFIDYLGRLDRQLKLRGHRIEPAEIEAALLEHPAVRACAVSLHEAPDGDRELVAYLVPAPAAGDDFPAAIEAFARQRLPAFLTPAHFVGLDALPTTASGKLDRRSLPAPPRRRGNAGRPPRDARERALVQIWQDALGASPLGIDDDFFALGGHSLRALRALTRIEATLGRAVPLALLFEHPTVASLLAALDAPTSGPAPCLQPLRTGCDRPPLFLVHAVEGHAIVYRDLARSLAPGRPVYALRARGLEPGEAPATDVGAMAERYLEEIRRLRPRGPYALGGWSAGGTIAFEMAQRLARPGESPAPLVLIDAFAPTGAAFGPDDELALLAALGNELARRAGAAIEAITSAELRQIPETNRIAYLCDRALGGRALSAELAALRPEALARVALANARAIASYRPTPYAGPTLLLRATERPDPGIASPEQGWRALAPNLHCADVEGDHHGLVRPPHVTGVAHAIDRWLDRHDLPSPRGGRGLPAVYPCEQRPDRAPRGPQAVAAPVRRAKVARPP
jgi:amino acid adenylation domain-containing protein